MRTGVQGRAAAVVVIEDVATTGKAMVERIGILRDAGLVLARAA